MENYESFFLFFSFGWQREPRDLVLANIGSGSKPTAPETGGVKQDNQQWISVFCGEATRF